MWFKSHISCLNTQVYFAVEKLWASADYFLCFTSV